MSMFRIFKRRKKMNHKGMTLIEVIVAMAILAIVVVPTLHMFVSASSNNLRSKLRQRATFVGESVMESFKAYSVEELCKQFSANDFAGVTKGSSTTMNAKGYYGSSEGYKDALLFNTELNRDAEHYLFTAKNVVSEGHSYDVQIKATPRVEPTDVLRYESPNAYTDAIIKFPESINTEAQTYFSTEAVNKFNAAFPAGGNKVYTRGAITFSDFKRTFTIKIVDTSGVQKVEASVKCECKANVAYTWTSTAVTGGTGSNGGDTASFDLTYDVLMPPGNTTTTDKIWLAYDNSSTISGQVINGKTIKMENIYLYYYPAYEETFGAGAKDIFKFEGNLSNIYNPATAPKGVNLAKENGYAPLNVYIAKQKSTRIDDTSLDWEEYHYNVSVEENISDSGKVNLYSNLRQNVSGGSYVNPTPTVVGFDSADDLTLSAPLVGEVQLLYDLDVYVYEAGSIDANNIAPANGELVHFVSTKND